MQQPDLVTRFDPNRRPDPRSRRQWCSARRARHSRAATASSPRAAEARRNRTRPPSNSSRCPRAPCSANSGSRPVDHRRRLSDPRAGPQPAIRPSWRSRRASSTSLSGAGHARTCRSNASPGANLTVVAPGLSKVPIESVSVASLQNGNFAQPAASSLFHSDAPVFSLLRDHPITSCSRRSLYGGAWRRHRKPLRARSLTSPRRLTPPPHPVILN